MYTQAVCFAFVLLLPSVAALSGCASSYERGHDSGGSFPPSDDEIDDILAWDGAAPSIMDELFAVEYATDTAYCECAHCLHEPMQVTDRERACFYVAAGRDPDVFIEYFSAWIDLYNDLGSCFEMTDCGDILRGDCSQDPPDALLHAPPAPVARAVMTCGAID
jgi:hypothetical protein